MPVKYEMRWVPSQRRWTKQYRGTRYWISCRQLGALETKEESRESANRWWLETRAKIDAASKTASRAPLPLEDIAAASIGVSPDLFGNVRELLEAALLREEDARPKGKPIAPGDDEITIDAPDPDEAETIRRREVMGMLEQLLFGADAKIPETAAAQLPPARVSQIENAVKELKGESAATPERSVRAHVEKWFLTQNARVGKGLSPDRVNVSRLFLSHLAAFLGEAADVRAVNEASLEGFYRFCLSKIDQKDAGSKSGWSVATAKAVFSTARVWIRWLDERGAIGPLRNIASKTFKFESTNQSVLTWTPQECKYVIGEAPGKLKLALLLMLNCGMTQQDVSDLKDSEVDWKKGRITRKRSKTRKRKSTPVVCYKLWPLTFELLRKNRSGTDYVLLTESGKPYVRKKLVNGRLVKADGFASCYGPVKKRLKFNKPMKQLRKTGATMLGEHPTYGRFTGLFLGHAPLSMADRSYAAVPQTLFDEAVLWLGKQLGLSD